jgi:hypothetical protein
MVGLLAQGLIDLVWPWEPQALVMRWIVRGIVDACTSQNKFMSNPTERARRHLPVRWLHGALIG